MTIKSQAIFWSLTTLALFTFIYIFQGVLLPFVLGLAIAYLLNPLVHALGRIKIPRKIAALIILLLFIAIVGTSFALILPVLYKQSLALVDEAPRYIESLTAYLEPHTGKLQSILGISNGDDLKALMSEHTNSAANIAKKLIASLAAGGQAFIDVLTLLVITPLVAYFMMNEWEHITKWVEDLLPRDHKNTIKDLLAQIDTKISGFVRGQISVALILAIAYAIALSIAGLKYGFLIGLMAGLLSVIPMIGSVIGLFTSIIVAWFQAGDLGYVALIAGIFLIGQIIEGNFLSPKIVGDSVGLHPLWIFFALFAGGALFGILGMLLAVPIAAIAGVLLAFTLTQYKSSPLYKGKPRRKKKAPQAKRVNHHAHNAHKDIAPKST
ncbi:MAG: AI-2E family transporter [Alphaproteobacteria bacterium]